MGEVRHVGVRFGGYLDGGGRGVEQGGVAGGDGWEEPRGWGGVFRG